MQILGLRCGKIYKSINELRYGHVMIMTDQGIIIIKYYILLLLFIDFYKNIYFYKNRCRW